MSIFRYTVRETPPHATVSGVLTRQLGMSRLLIRRLKAVDGIYLNGQAVRVNHPAQEGDELELRLPEAPSEKVDPEPVPLDILYEDADLIVLNKPPGLVVHPTHGCYHGTLANGLAHYFQSHQEAVGIHPVHRIDRDTSGLVVFAKHSYAHQQLAGQLEEFKLDREYLAIAEGLLEQDHGVIEAPIARRSGPGGYREIAPHGQTATTHYQVLARSKETSETLLVLRLETGRTHQIRVHLQFMGHPLLADKLYGRPHATLQRQALHARTLSFRHPRTQELMRLVAPLPSDLSSYVASVFGLSLDLA
ncbi:MAG TPA: RluA family pseudouridine synthase [Stenomitos sp.]